MKTVVSLINHTHRNIEMKVQLGNVTLGDEVKDSITGFKGVAVIRHTYLQGCDRISVIGQSTTDLPNPPELSFDEPQLIITKAKKVVGNRDTTKGGPARHIPQPKSTGIKK